ncbi:MAG: putative bifunctional diguanylate cyclase/phosphodiesterase [Leptospirillia bacterium]
MALSRIIDLLARASPGARRGRDLDHPGQATKSLLRTTIILTLAATAIILTNVFVFFQTNGTLRQIAQTAARYRHVKNDLHSVSASLFVMVQARAPLPLSERALFRGYQIQAVSTLSDMERRSRDLLPGEVKNVRALDSLFVYASLQNVERVLRNKLPPGSPVIPRALSSRMYALIGILDRQIVAQEKHLQARDLLLRHRRSLLVDASFLIFLALLASFMLLERRSIGFLKTLEFEVDLTKKLLITSDVIREWKEFTKNLLIQINHTFPVRFLFSLFVTPEESFEIYVFWNGAPSDHEQEYFERTIGRRVHENRLLPEGRHLTFFHEIAHSGTPPPSQDEASIVLETETLLLERPQIGGIVGVGLAGTRNDAVRKLVVRGFLVSILNVLGSVKALSLYNKEIEYFAVRDPLTRLFNQRVFWELLEYEVGRAKRHDNSFAVCVLDLDDFKRVNDTFGHATGDRFLKEMAAILLSETRQGDILSRYGGDEFAFVLPEVDLTGATSIVDRIREKIDAFRMDPGEEHQTPIEASVSIGIALYPDHASDAQDLFSLADRMMYKAKQSGKNTYRAPDPGEALHLHKAGRRDTHLLDLVKAGRTFPYFQPLLDLSSRTVTGYEVLARLKDDDGRIIAAGEFISLVERAGLAAEMDFSILEKALGMALERGIEGRLFFNMTPYAMAANDFTNRIVDTVAKFPVPAERIAFEITERQAIKNVRIVENLIRELKALGFAFSIDDFGAGFSSHHYLREFPVDYLKIDGPFILGAGRGNTVDLAIVHSIVSLARSLGIKTVGEGIEDAATLEMATVCGVTYGQGYFVGGPGSAEEMVPSRNP